MKVQVYENQETSVVSYTVIMPFPMAERKDGKAWAIYFDIYSTPQARNVIYFGLKRRTWVTPFKESKSFKKRYKKIDSIEYPTWLSIKICQVQKLWSKVCSNHGESFKALVETIIEDDNEWNKGLTE